jgi:hypothetical protein
MSVHIVNKETGKETNINDFLPSSTQTTQSSITKQLLLEYGAHASDQEDIEMGAGDDFVFGDDDDDVGDIPKG